MIRVAAAIVRRGSRVLLARRTHPAWLAGKWEFPGGKIEPGETPETCLERELAEELGIRCRIGEHVLTTRHRYPEGAQGGAGGEGLELELVAHEAEHVAGVLAPTDHDRAEWVELVDLARYELAAADLPIAAALLLDR